MLDNYNNNVFLVGPMGAGKSTIGRHLAKSLNLTFKDSDREIETRTGADISLIFELEGEVGFRRREHDVIADLTQETQLVLATGGGVVLDPDNRTHLKQQGLVVYLQASVDTLIERTRHSRNRPLLQTANPRNRLEELMEQRHPLYQEVAHIVIETGNRTIRQVVKRILKRLEQMT